MKPTHSVLAACAAAILALTACGGGGGGTPAAQTQPATDTTRITASDARSIDPNETRASAGQAALSLPRFGSVTQSSNRNTAGITTDAASATFDGNGMTVRIVREDTSVLTLDTAYTIEDSGVAAYTDYYSTRSWGLFRVTNDETYIARVTATWANDDLMDQLTGGYWFYIAGDVSQPSSLTGFDVGAFVDGPELSGQPPSLPTIGIARYEGRSDGFLVGRYGTGYTAYNISEGSTVVGEYSSTATLTADFANNTIQGCIGCKDGLAIEASFTDGASGETTSLRSTEYIQIHLDTATFDQSGRFRAQNVRVTNLDAPADRPAVARAGGSWGGQFSNIDEDGAPRLAAGTVGADVERVDGTKAILVGTFDADQL